MEKRATMTAMLLLLLSAWLHAARAEDEFVLVATIAKSKCNGVVRLLEARMNWMCDKVSCMSNNTIQSCPGTHFKIHDYIENYVGFAHYSGGACNRTQLQSLTVAQNGWCHQDPVDPSLFYYEECVKGNDTAATKFIIRHNNCTTDKCDNCTVVSAPLNASLCVSNGDGTYVHGVCNDDEPAKSPAAPGAPQWAVVAAAALVVLLALA
eukprot:TRINITY_DN3784_c0_g1_i3.p2 TRINITY_DN3784_c0_g1~~TRINITY_DN3784_c0_g1_i3.p2  ORF type:complete len:216 (+),score=57.35 TRINITY_DN3784_c0_g1_i3:26-649(+)